MASAGTEEKYCLQEIPPDFSSATWFPDPNTWPEFTNLAQQEATRIYGQSLPAVLLTVNEAEFTAAIHQFYIIPHKEHPNLPFHKANMGAMTVYFAKIGSHLNPLAIGIIAQSETGSFGQPAAANAAIEHLRPRAVISMGVGWGNPHRGLDGSAGERARFGDVMVSRSITEFSVNARIGPEGQLVSRSEVPAAGPLLVQRFHNASLPGQWRFSRLPGTLASSSKVLLGKVATGGLLLDNKEFVTKLVSSFGDIIGGEMEAWGLYQAAQKALGDNIAVQWIVVKGICDWGSGKTDGWQPLAAAAAANLVFSVLSAPGALPPPPEVIGVLFNGCTGGPLQITLQTAQLVGREDAVMQVALALLNTRQAVIWGFAGEGKSSVAMEAGVRLWEAGACPRGAFEVDMAGLAGIAAGRCREYIAGQLLPAFQVQQADAGQQGDPAGSWDKLTQHLCSKAERCLLIFEN